MSPNFSQNANSRVIMEQNSMKEEVCAFTDEAALFLGQKEDTWF